KRAMHVQVDKPMYEPGDTIWVKVWNLDARSLSPVPVAREAQAEKPTIALTLQGPAGNELFNEAIEVAVNDTGVGHGFPIAKTGVGGVHTLTATLPDGQKVQRSVFVNAFVVPRLQMKLDFERKAYGVGDTVEATFEVKDNQGLP